MQPGAVATPGPVDQTFSIDPTWREGLLPPSGGKNHPFLADEPRVFRRFDTGLRVEEDVAGPLTRCGGIGEVASVFIPCRIDQGLDIDATEIGTMGLDNPRCLARRR